VHARRPEKTVHASLEMCRLRGRVPTPNSSARTTRSRVRWSTESRSCVRWSAQSRTSSIAEGKVWAVSFFECTACNTKVLTTGSGCPTKNLESKFGELRSKDRVAWLDVCVTRGTLRVAACASHRVACRDAFRMAFAPVYRGTKHDRTMTQRQPCNPKHEEHAPRALVMHVTLMA
jgi:hypothetical protein